MVHPDKPTDRPIGSTPIGNAAEIVVVKGKVVKFRYGPTDSTFVIVGGAIQIIPEEGKDAVIDPR